MANISLTFITKIAVHTTFPFLNDFSAFCRQALPIFWTDFLEFTSTTLFNMFLYLLLHSFTNYLSISHWKMKPSFTFFHPPAFTTHTDTSQHPILYCILIISNPNSLCTLWWLCSHFSQLSHELYTMTTFLFLFLFFLCFPWNYFLVCITFIFITDSSWNCSSDCVNLFSVQSDIIGFLTISSSWRNLCCNHLACSNVDCSPFRMAAQRHPCNLLLPSSWPFLLTFPCIRPSV